jgi:signal transduction histidine kinase
MARLGASVSGRTLDVTKGFAGLRPADLWYRVRRTALTLVSMGALIAGLAATAAALGGSAQTGVTPGNVGETVIAVSPTGYGWTAGIRPGQIIDVLGDSRDPNGWRIETHDALGQYRASAQAWDELLRSFLPIAIGSVLLAWLSLVFLRTHRRWALPTAAVAVLIASIPLQLEGSPGSSTLAMGGAALLPALAYTSRLPSFAWFRWAASAIVVALIAAWGVARLAGAESYESAEFLRSSVAFWATLALVFERGLLPAMTGQPVGLVRPKLFDVVVVAGLAVLAVAIGIALQLPALVPIIMVAVVLALIPGIRQRLARPIEYLLLGDVREQAAAEAAEDERARLARELHDVPLQELAAVIRRLEIVPGTEAESENLRQLAGHLRNVATELRPPVLDDLGLPAALDFLAEEATTPTMPVTAEVVDDTGFGADRRPPTDVELAMFRIASEAVKNAVRHSGGSAVHVQANITPNRVEVEIRDDGAGLASEAAHDAARRKRLGLASMRRRAEAIDAELSIDGSKQGTTVRVAWQA